MAASYALVLKGGTIVDGSGRPRFQSDVAIEGDRIAGIGRDLRGQDALNCDGLVVAPGFIDTHSHSDLIALADPRLPMKVRQGITLEVFGQDGLSVAPVKSEDKSRVRTQLAGLLGDPPIEWNWQTVGEYLIILEQKSLALDCCYLVPHGAIRQWVVGDENRKATAQQLKRMVRLLEQAMREGAMGLSTGLIYPPCCYADKDELLALCKKVSELDGVFVVHMRSESDRITEAIEEMIDIGRGTGVRVHISHFKIAGRENWSDIEKILNLVREAREKGVKMTADQYPYIAGSTMLGAILPPWAHDGGVDATLRRLQDPATRERMRQQMASMAKADWDNFWKWSGPEGIIISDIPSGRHSDLIGQSLAEAAALRGKEAFEFAFDLLLEEKMGVAMVSFSQSEAIVERIMREEYVNVCTDGLLGGKPHPRAYGTYPRILGRYVREKKVLTLEEAVRKMTAQAAEAFNLREHGYVKEGYYANLVVFDPETIVDEATFQDPIKFSQGILHVFVRGKPVIVNGEQREIFPGRVVRAGTSF